MDLTGALSNLQQSKTIAEVQMRVAKKILDSQRDQGAAAIQLLEAAGSGVANAGDSLVAAATGLGGSVDAYA